MEELVHAIVGWAVCPDCHQTCDVIETETGARVFEPHHSLDTPCPEGGTVPEVINEFDLVDSEFYSETLSWPKFSRPIVVACLILIACLMVTWLYMSINHTDLSVWFGSLQSQR